MTATNKGCAWNCHGSNHHVRCPRNAQRMTEAANELPPLVVTPGFYDRHIANLPPHERGNIIRGRTA